MSYQNLINMKHRYLEVITLIIAGVLFVGQNIAAAPVRFLPWDMELAARKIGLGNAKDVSELQDLHPHKRSKSYKGPVGDVPLELVALDRKDAEGNPTRTKIKIPQDFVSPLVLIIPDEKNPTGMRTFVIDDSASKFSWGSFRYINASGKALLVSQDKKIVKLPASWQPVDFSPGGSMRNVGIQFVAQDDVKNVRYSAFWEHDPDIRKLVFIVLNLDGSPGAINCKIIPENRRTLDAPATSGD